MSACYTPGMPTTRLRHMITETDDVERAIDEAALKWPELDGDRAALVRRVFALGADAVHESREVRLAERRRAIRETAGSMSGVWPPGAIEELRAEWPG